MHVSMIVILLSGVLFRRSFGQSSNGWRIAHSSAAIPSWDVTYLDFYESDDCSGSYIDRTAGTAISSPPVEGFGDANRLFDSYDGDWLALSADTDGTFYVGKMYDQEYEVQCAVFKNNWSDSLTHASSVFLQRYDSLSNSWTSVVGRYTSTARYAVNQVDIRPYHSTGWRIYTPYFGSGGWDLAQINFYESQSCSGERIDQNLGTIIKSGEEPNYPTFGATAAFDDDPYSYWAGRVDANNVFYIGKIFDRDIRIMCVAVTNAETNSIYLASSMTFQMYDHTNDVWVDVHHGATNNSIQWINYLVILDSAVPTSIPSPSPSYIPSYIPSIMPSTYPSFFPTSIPSLVPSKFPSQKPSLYPSLQPSRLPSLKPSLLPSHLPSQKPSLYPSLQPSRLPSLKPSLSPSHLPSNLPSTKPSPSPSGLPSQKPSLYPSLQPSSQPSRLPSLKPSLSPSRLPSSLPSSKPSLSPSDLPSQNPSLYPSLQPSSQPNVSPSLMPTVSPSRLPTYILSTKPSLVQSSLPSLEISLHPSLEKSSQPSSQPNVSPSLMPTVSPSLLPTDSPSLKLSFQPTSESSILPSYDLSHSPSNISSKIPSFNPSLKQSFPSSLYDSSIMMTMSPTTIQSITLRMDIKVTSADTRILLDNDLIASATVSYLNGLFMDSNTQTRVWEARRLVNHSMRNRLNVADGSLLTSKSVVSMYGSLNSNEKLFVVIFNTLNETLNNFVGYLQSRVSSTISDIYIYDEEIANTQYPSIQPTSDKSYSPTVRTISSISDEYMINNFSVSVTFTGKFKGVMNTTHAHDFELKNCLHIASTFNNMGVSEVRVDDIEVSVITQEPLLNRRLQDVELLDLKVIFEVAIRNTQHIDIIPILQIIYVTDSSTYMQMLRDEMPYFFHNDTIIASQYTVVGLIGFNTYPSTKPSIEPSSLETFLKTNVVVATAAAGAAAAAASSSSAAASSSAASSTSAAGSSSAAGTKTQESQYKSTKKGFGSRKRGKSLSKNTTLTDNAEKAIETNNENEYCDESDHCENDESESENAQMRCGDNEHDAENVQTEVGDEDIDVEVDMDNDDTGTNKISEIELAYADLYDYQRVLRVQSHAVIFVIKNKHGLLSDCNRCKAGCHMSSNCMEKVIENA